MKKRAYLVCVTSAIALLAYQSPARTFQRGLPDNGLAPAGIDVKLSSSRVVAHTAGGDVVGEQNDGLATFKGVPFARAPVGALRWRPPLPPRSWHGARLATTFAPACMQTPNPPMNLPDQTVSEDCLYLNVWSPAKPGKRLPVIVWIYGGGFSYGSTAMPLFDGAALARRGVVFVSIAYRVGPFGYLALPSLTRESPHRTSGNYALLDQIAALQWVRGNILSFGGDPARITVMGESAGAISAGGLAQSPLAAGLFIGIIAQSGANFGPEWGAMTTLVQAEAEGTRLAAILHAPTLKSLRRMPATAIMKSTPRGAHAFTLMSSLPIIDGYIVPADPLKLYSNRQFNDTPILIGSNEEEGMLFPGVSNRADYETEIRRRYGSQTSTVLSLYPARDDAEAASSWYELIGDAAFGMPEYTWAELQSAYGAKPVFFYRFAQSPPPRPTAKPGPVHGAELPYVFGAFGVRKLAWTDADRELSDRMGAYWTNFAKFGDPNGAGLSIWPRYTKAARATLILNATDEVTAEPPAVNRLRRLSVVTFGDAVP